MRERKGINKFRRLGMHGLRIALVISLAGALRFSGERRIAQASASNQANRPVAVDAILPLLPNASTLADPDANGVHVVLDADGNAIGRVTQTSPTGDSAVGYRGPSNSILLLDDAGVVRAVRIDSSQDTPEHAAAVMGDETFLRQFRGWQLGRSNPSWQIDGTSGATLTSLAIAESIAIRLGPTDRTKRSGSLRFPDAITPNEVHELFGDGARIDDSTTSDTYCVVIDRSGAKLGTVMRTGPLVDTLVGYQGPSEIVLAFDVTGKTTQLRLRGTFDNEPYVDYVRDEAYYWKAFLGKTLEQLAEFQPEQAGVEGVSGATMTSLVVADTIVAAAKRQLQQVEDRNAAEIAKRRKNRIRWTPHDVGTAVVLVIAALIGTTRLRAVRWFRGVWLVVLIAYFGLVTGNLVSQAILMGWSASGVPWRLAPGLFAVLMIALLFPACGKTNLYCSHLCPHGAAQQLLLRQRIMKPIKLSAPVRRVLSMLPAGLLSAAFLVTLLGLPWNLANWEPFNAYIWYVSGVASIALAILSLLASLAIPMAYCRFGCPTGSLLDYYRFHARSDRLTHGDALAITMSLLAWSWLMLT